MRGNREQGTGNRGGRASGLAPVFFLPVWRVRSPQSRAWRLLQLAVIILFPVPCSLFPAACSPGTRPFDVARVAVVAPLTGEGREAGRDVADAVGLAVEEWNGAGGVHGLRLELVAHDEGDAQTARRLMADPHVVLAVGYPHPAAAAPAWQAHAQTSAPAAILLAGPASPAGSGAPGIVALAPTNEQVAEVVAAAIAYNFGPTTVAVVAPGNNEDMGAARAFVQVAPARGLQVIAETTLAGTESDYARTAALLRTLAPAVVYVVGRGMDAGALWTQLRLREARTRLVLAPGALDTGFYRTAGGFFDGVVAIALSTWPVDAPAAVAFRQAFTARFGRPPSALAARAYDAATLGLRAIAAASTGKAPARSAVRSALTAETNFSGVLRDYTLAAGIPAAWSLAVYRLDREGTPSLIGGAEVR